MMEIEEEETRKGPWTEQEDVQLTDYVCLFGQRRWEFIAKVSGLRRTGKSCRLRWVNYLHPGLKRGRISPQEERIILKLHSRWGNRWSRIARKLPGRTDNQIKNYWRTRMRKKAQEKQQTSSPTLSSSSSPSSMNCHTLDTMDKSHVVDEKECAKGCYTMDEIWKEITCLEEVYKEGCEGCSYPCPPMTSPLWYNCSESLWGANIDEDIKQHELK